jgi:DNA invertase Pin-like site-specific DNA recombinase
MKQLFAYIRVSDPKQGEGVSLEAQRSAIERCAAQNGFEIATWFEERKTAAKRGRPIFNRMLQQLKAGAADGVVMHKIDRSARNLRDWIDLGDLIDAGVQVHFAHEALDLKTRGGRLSADIQAVVAADYIRNLREEALKGIRGRLQQGIYPFGAPMGYLNRGKGKPKDIDPVVGPLVKELFELYATGSYSLRMLREEALRLGLRNRRSGAPLRLQSIHGILRNPFYVGLMLVKQELLPGAHQPLVTRSLFDTVQGVLTGKCVRGRTRREFLFRRRLKCLTCGRSLVGEMHKGYVYYRCQTISCPTTSVREEAVDAAFRSMIAPLRFGKTEQDVLFADIQALDGANAVLRTARLSAVRGSLATLNARLSRLTDLLIDGKIDRESHDAKRAEMLAERQRLDEELQLLEADTSSATADAVKVLELAATAETLYESADMARKAQLLNILVLNGEVTGKSIAFSLTEPFRSISSARSVAPSGLGCYTPRTFPAEELVADCPRETLDTLRKTEFPAPAENPTVAA